MRSRPTSTNYFLHRQPLASIDEFIAKKNLEGKNYTYRDIVVATLVRIFAIRPKFNRFYVGDKLYQRNHIDFAMTVHKSLRKGDQEAIAKVRFSGFETLAEVKEKLDTAIKTAIESNDSFDAVMGRFPNFILRFAMRMIRLFDRLGWLSDKFMFEASPFHSSIFFADLKSIHLNYVFHHLYTFGNCGFFCTMGKEHYDAMVNPEDGSVYAGKIIELGVSMDERFVDGLYYRHMVKGVSRIMQDLSTLEEPLTPEQIFTP